MARIRYTGKEDKRIPGVGRVTGEWTSCPEAIAEEFKNEPGFEVKFPPFQGEGQGGDGSPAPAPIIAEGTVNSKLKTKNSEPSVTPVSSVVKESGGKS